MITIDDGVLSVDGRWTNNEQEWKAAAIVGQNVAAITNMVICLYHKDTGAFVLGAHVPSTIFSAALPDEMVVAAMYGQHKLRIYATAGSPNGHLAMVMGGYGYKTVLCVVRVAERLFSVPLVLPKPPASIVLHDDLSVTSEGAKYVVKW